MAVGFKGFYFMRQQGKDIGYLERKTDQNGNTELKFYFQNQTSLEMVDTLMLDFKVQQMTLGAATDVNDIMKNLQQFLLNYMLPGQPDLDATAASEGVPLIIQLDDSHPAGVVQTSYQLHHAHAIAPTVDDQDVNFSIGGTGESHSVNVQGQVVTTSSTGEQHVKVDPLTGAPVNVRTESATPPVEQNELVNLEESLAQLVLENNFRRAVVPPRFYNFMGADLERLLTKILTASPQASAQQQLYNIQFPFLVAFHPPHCKGLHIRGIFSFTQTISYDAEENTITIQDSDDDNEPCYIVTRLYLDQSGMINTITISQNGVVVLEFSSEPFSVENPENLLEPLLPGKEFDKLFDGATP